MRHGVGEGFVAGEFRTFKLYAVRAVYRENQVPNLALKALKLALFHNGVAVIVAVGVEVGDGIGIYVVHIQQELFALDLQQLHSAKRTEIKLFDISAQFRPVSEHSLNAFVFCLLFSVRLVFIEVVFVFAREERCGFLAFFYRVFEIFYLGGKFTDSALRTGNLIFKAGDFTF